MLGLCSGFDVLTFSRQVARLSSVLQVAELLM